MDTFGNHDINIWRPIFEAEGLKRVFNIFFNMRSLDTEEQTWWIICHELEMEAMMYTFFDICPLIMKKTDSLPHIDKLKNCVSYGFNVSFQKLDISYYWENKPRYSYTMREGDSAQVTYNYFNTTPQNHENLKPKLEQLLTEIDGFENFVVTEDVIENLLCISRGILQGRGNVF